MVEKLSEGTRRTEKVTVVHEADDRIEFVATDREQAPPRKGRAAYYFGFFAAFLGIFFMFMIFFTPRRVGSGLLEARVLESMIAFGAAALICFIISAVLLFLGRRRGTLGPPNETSIVWDTGSMRAEPQLKVGTQAVPASQIEAIAVLASHPDGKQTRWDLMAVCATGTVELITEHHDGQMTLQLAKRLSRVLGVELRQSKMDKVDTGIKVKDILSQKYDRGI